MMKRAKRMQSAGRPEAGTGSGAMRLSQGPLRLPPQPQSAAQGRAPRAAALWRAAGALLALLAATLLGPAGASAHGGAQGGAQGGAEAGSKSLGGIRQCIPGVEPNCPDPARKPSPTPTPTPPPIGAQPIVLRNLVEVSPYGYDLPNSTRPVRTIAYALRLVRDGGVILVHDGVYEEKRLDIFKSVTIKAAAAGGDVQIVAREDQCVVFAPDGLGGGRPKLEIEGVDFISLGVAWPCIQSRGGELRMHNVRLDLTRSPWGAGVDVMRGEAHLSRVTMAGAAAPLNQPLFYQRVAETGDQLEPAIELWRVSPAAPALLRPQCSGFQPGLTWGPYDGGGQYGPRPGAPDGQIARAVTPRTIPRALTTEEARRLSMEQPGEGPEYLRRELDVDAEYRAAMAHDAAAYGLAPSGLASQSYHVRRGGKWRIGDPIYGEANRYGAPPQGYLPQGYMNDPAYQGYQSYPGQHGAAQPWGAGGYDARTPFPQEYDYGRAPSQGGPYPDPYGGYDPYANPYADPYADPYRHGGSQSPYPGGQLAGGQHQGGGYAPGQDPGWGGYYSDGPAPRSEADRAVGAPAQPFDTPLEPRRQLGQALERSEIAAQDKRSTGLCVDETGKVEIVQSTIAGFDVGAFLVGEALLDGAETLQNGVGVQLSAPATFNEPVRHSFLSSRLNGNDVGLLVPSGYRGRISANRTEIKWNASQGVYFGQVDSNLQCDLTGGGSIVESNGARLTGLQRKVLSAERVEFVTWAAYESRLRKWRVNNPNFLLSDAARDACILPRGFNSWLGKTRGVGINEKPNLGLLPVPIPF